MTPHPENAAGLPPQVATEKHWLWELDKGLNYVWISPGYGESVHLLPGSLIGCGLDANAFDTQGIEKRNWLLLQKTVSMQRPFSEFVYRIRTPDGSRVWHALSGQPVFADDGRFSGYRGTGKIATRQMEEKIFAETALLIAEAKIAIAAILQDVDRPFEERCQEALAHIFTLDELAVDLRGGLFLREPGASHLQLLTTFGNFSEGFLTRQAWLAMGEGLCGKAAALGHTLVSSRCDNDSDRDSEPDPICDMPGLAPHGHYILPLMYGTEAVGVLFFYTTPNPSQDPHCLGDLEHIASLFTQAVLTERSRKLLVQARIEAETTAKLKGDFIRNMSHEFRTPLNSILGLTEGLLQTALDEQQRELVTLARASAGQLLAHIVNILDFSRAEHGQLPLEPTEFDLNSLLTEIVKPFENSARSKGLSFTFVHDATIPARLLGDSRRLRQVIDTLIDNAVKFTRFGGITVKVANESAPSDGLLLRFTIRDTGIGIPADKQHLLFQPFSQIDSSMTRPFEGAGMSLALARQLAILLGGDIGVSSEPGNGAEFWITAQLNAVGAETTR